MFRVLVCFWCRIADLFLFCLIFQFFPFFSFFNLSFFTKVFFNLSVFRNVLFYDFLKIWLKIIFPKKTFYEVWIFFVKFLFTSKEIYIAPLSPVTTNFSQNMSFYVTQILNGRISVSFYRLANLKIYVREQAWNFEIFENFLKLGNFISK